MAPAQHLLVIGAGYSGQAAATLGACGGLAGQRHHARAPRDRARSLSATPAPLAAATHLLVTAPPGEAGDRSGPCTPAALRAAPLAWVGYLSTTGVYGDRGGAWVDETARAQPQQQPRSRRRLAAEQQWQALPCAVDVFRTAASTGPAAPRWTTRAPASRVASSSPVTASAASTATTSRAPASPPPRVRTATASCTWWMTSPPPAPTFPAEAARLLGLDPPPEIPFEAAAARMSEMALSFWSENRRVSTGSPRPPSGWSGSTRPLAKG
jgi:hypothetical protein